MAGYKIDRQVIAFGEQCAAGAWRGDGAWAVLPAALLNRQYLTGRGSLAVTTGRPPGG